MHTDMTPYHIARGSGVGVVYMLLRAGAGLQARDASRAGRPPQLWVAARYGCLDVVEMALTFSADVTVLMVASVYAD
jgi:hypothetical protein